MRLNSRAYNYNETQRCLTPITELCKRVRFRQSECQACVEICPTNAISLAFGPELNDACMNCGLCQIACPTEVFENTLNTDQLLLDLLQEPTDNIASEHKLFIHCHQAEAENLHSVAVTCLGSMTENALMAMVGANVQTVMLSVGSCVECQLYQGIKLFKQAISIFNSLDQLNSRTKMVINSREKQRTTQPRLSVNRREFFRTISTSVAEQAARVVVEKEQQIRALLSADDPGLQKRPSPRREILKALLLDHCEDTFEAAANVTLPWEKMLVDAEHCVGCGVCVNVCPTGALFKEIHQLELKRTINYGLCTNCGVCAEACPQDVIRFDRRYQIDDIVRETQEVVAKMALNACTICGEIIPVSEGKVCTTCQKRQVVPMFM